jgi:thymidylate synthase (FAD)
MTLISNSVSEIKDTKPGKKIEFCARTSYASQDKITEDSHIAFIQNLVRAGHTSTLEHENVVVECSSEIFSNYFAKFFAIDNFNTKFFNFTEKNGVTVFSSNIRGWFNFLYSIKVPTSYTMAAENILYKKYPYIFKYNHIEGSFAEKNLEEVDPDSLDYEQKKMHKLYTFMIVGSRAFTHQIVRHRRMSFLQQSQRYCNFSKEKFGHNISFIEPDVVSFLQEAGKSDEEIYNVRKEFTDLFQTCEDTYFKLIDSGCKPEDARAVLPNAAASIITVSATIDDWERFFALRCDGHAQEEIRFIALKIRSCIYEKEKIKK